MNKKTPINFKIFFYSTVLLIIFIIIFFFSYKKYPNFYLAKFLLKKKSIIENINNDYNVKFLPETQFLRLEFKKKKLGFIFDKKSTEGELNLTQYGSKSNSFNFDIYNDTLWLADVFGKIYNLDLKYINEDKNYLELKNIETNLVLNRTLDIFIYKNILYISYITNENNCKKINIDFSYLDIKRLNFNQFFRTKECANDVGGGRMQFYKHSNTDGILLTTDNGSLEPSKDPQNDKSIYGKILFIDFQNKKHITFSKGHRNSQGLYAKNKIILSTEHGPRGGDEINKIIFKKNYGWPIASYGEGYDFKYESKPKYYKEHENLQFEEPIFSFVPSIGISELIRLPNSFSDHFQDNFIISSLNDKSIYRIKFDKNYSKVIYIEKIFVGERIRDIKYYNNLILLALEDTGSIGIISKK
jgi:hypothetical protein